MYPKGNKMFPFWVKQKVYLLLHFLKLKSYKMVPNMVPKGYFGSKKQKTPQEEGF